MSDKALDRWLDDQEEQQRREEILGAMRDARESGVSPEAILNTIAGAEKAYKQLRNSPLNLKRTMVDVGVLSEIDSILRALKMRTAEAKKKKELLISYQEAEQNRGKKHV